MIRTSPMQERSKARLKNITDAARRVIEDKGRDRFTTQDVAKAAGCSIGSFYRYFPDRVAVLDHLFPKRDTAQEVLDSVRAFLTDSKVRNPRERIRSAVEAINSSGLY